VTGRHLNFVLLNTTLPDVKANHQILSNWLKRATSLNRPGGNITGASFLTAAIAGKRLELFRELMPTASVIDYLVNPDDALGRPEITDAEAAARMHRLKLRLSMWSMRGANTTSTRGRRLV
jgi:ABC-type uncharacterized transport system substrate-binding protein